MFQSSKTFNLFAVFHLICVCCIAQERSTATIFDQQHYSNVMGENRNYRVFLPPSYSSDTTRRFPVIYFMHGWGQRYFGDGTDAYASFDKGNDNNGDNIANYVARHNVIVVKSDGYNRRRDEEYYVRPYNVTPVETYRQFPPYFPELIHHIDQHFRTLSNRNHRGISGLSMGGFMTYWIAAKYPHLFSAAGSFCGSPEFEVGPVAMPIEYRHIDMYKNLEGVNVRLHYGDKDFIRDYHHDMNLVWPQLMNNYSYKVFDAEHSTAGLGEMFDFILNTFKNPPKAPEKWSHTDVYPAFSVWGYDVSTDRSVPGFTTLEDVNKRGFRCAVRQHVPDGELLTSTQVAITTPPIYQKNTEYIINDIDLRTGISVSRKVRAGADGKLQITINGGNHEIGINAASDGPELAIATAKLEGTAWITAGEETKLHVQLLNKGNRKANKISTTLRGFRNNLQVTTPAQNLTQLEINAIGGKPLTFSFKVNDTVEVVKFLLEMRDGSNNQWTEDITFPVRKNLPAFQQVSIADGRSVTVVNGGTGQQKLVLGKGNGDGIANPGESIVVLVNDSNKLYRTDLLVSGNYVNPFGTNVRRSDTWTNFDHVGASAKYDVPLIAGNTPQNHLINMLAEYWVAEYPFHHTRRGLVSIRVSGEDKTPPIIDHVEVGPDNKLSIKVTDGSKISEVRAKLILKKDSSKTVDLSPADTGKNGDQVPNDNVFSISIPEQRFGIYRVIVEAKDEHENAVVEEWNKEVVVH